MGRVRSRVLVTGAGGQLGRDVATSLAGELPAGGDARSPYAGAGSQARSDLEVVAADHTRLRVEEREAVLEAVDGLRPSVVVHCAAMTNVDGCETNPEAAYAVNAIGTRNIAEAAQRFGAHLVYLSTDYVFDGRSSRAYVEWDETNPMSVYGRSKLGGERECPPGSTIIRTAWVSGARGKNMVRTALRLAQGTEPLKFVDDQRGSPTFTADLAGAVSTFALERLPGVFHITNQGSCSWYELVSATLELAGHAPGGVVPISTAELQPPRPAPRPTYSVLDNAALRLGGHPLLPDWHDGLERLVRAIDALGDSWL